MHIRQRRSCVNAVHCITMSTLVLSVFFLISAPRFVAAQFEASGGLGRIVHAPLSSLNLQSKSDWNDKYSAGMIATLPSLAELAGTWNISTLASGPGAPYWFRGRITVISDGSWTGTGQDYGEDPGPISGSCAVSADGTILLYVINNPNPAQCRIDKDFDIMVCTETWTRGEPGTSNLIILTKEATSYSSADLTGQWEFNALASGLSAPWWSRGSITVNSDGTATCSLVDNKGSPDTEGDTFSITSEGLITIQSTPDALCRMDVNKAVIACTSTWSDGTAALLTFVKKASTYSMADLVGPWSVNALATGPGAPWWERGPVNISSDGSFTGRIEDYDGTTYNMSGSAGTFAISPEGIVTIQRNGEEFRCAMNSGKTVLICTGTWTSGDPETTEMKILIKRLPCDYTINTTSKSVKAKGGSVSIKVAAKGDFCMEPSVVPGDEWITAAEVTKWAKNKGSIKIAIEKNDSSIVRSGTIMIGGQPLAITQQGQKCVIESMDPSSQPVPLAGGPFSFLFTVYPNDCSWTASTTSTFIHGLTLSGTGTWTIDYSVDPNTTGKKQSGKITMLLPVSGKKKSFSVKQAGN